MARIDIDAWEGREVTRVYIAGRMAEAQEVERILTERGVDYAVDLEPFRLMVLGIFPSQHMGVGFWVLSGQAAYSRQILLGAGLTIGIEDEVD